MSGDNEWDGFVSEREVPHPNEKWLLTFDGHQWARETMRYSNVTMTYAQHAALTAQLKRLGINVRGTA